MLDTIIYKIKNRQGPIFSGIYFVAKKILQFNVPAIKWIYYPLFILFTLIRKTWNYFVQKYIFEPMFKVNCVKVGKRFQIDKGFPSFGANLQMSIGDDVRIDGKNTFACSSVHKNPRLIIGNNVCISYGTTISVGREVSIGDDCLIAGGVFICDNNGHPQQPSKRHDKISEEEILPVKIGNNVWVASNAFIGRGVTIGDGAIVGAHSVVIEDVETNTIVSGIPAKVIKKLEQ